MKYLVILLYLVFWIVLSEGFTVESGIIGLMIVLTIYRFNRINGKRKQGKLKVLHFKYAIEYAMYLIKEIFKSNFQVAKIVLSPKMKISPTIVEVKTKVKPNVLKTILANSITLTPGTLTLFLNENKLIIHCLQKENEKDLINSGFENILLKTEECKYD